MKLNAAKIEEAKAWVEQNGLYPQACGSPVKDFCEAMGIDDATYRRWLQKAEFAEAITRARELFHTNTVRDVENALVKAAKGVDFVHIREEKKAQKVKEYDEKGRKIKEYDGQPIVVKSMRETVYYPPDVRAAQFVLSNMAPDKWRQKQETVVSTPEGVTLHYDKPEQKELLETLGE